MKGVYYMKDKEKSQEYDYRFIKKLLKSLLYTFLMFLFTVFVVLFLIESVFGGSDTSVIVSFCITIIFLIVYSTMTIKDKIKEIK